MYIVKTLKLWNYFFRLSKELPPVYIIDTIMRALLHFATMIISSLLQAESVDYQLILDA